jgi:MoxR-like ATPase/Mg-chelatase subunit ChlD
VTTLVGRRVERRTCIAALRAGRDLLVEGPAGTGKSILVRDVAAAVGRPVTVVEGSAAVTGAALLGHHDPAAVLRTGFSAAGHVDGPLIVAMRQGRLLHLEEANRLPPDTLNVLLGPLGERCIVVPRVGLVTAAPGFGVIATVNDEDTTGTHPLSRAFGERLVRLRLAHLRAGEERTVVRAHAPDAPRWLLRAAVAITRATRVHPDLARGASVRGAIDLLLVVRALAELEDLDLHERDARAQTALLRACMVALSGRVAVHEACARTAEDVLREVWEDAMLLRVATTAGPTTTAVPPSDVLRRGTRPLPTAHDGEQTTTHEHGTPADGTGEATAAHAGPGGRSSADGGGSGGPDPSTAVVSLTDDELDDLAEIATGSAGRAGRRSHRRRLSGTDPRLVHRLAVQVIVQRARLTARGKRGSGRLRSARFRFQSDDLDLDRSVEELAANPFPGHEDFWVRERSAGRRAVVLMLDVSGSMRGAPLVRAALAAASAAVAAAEDDFATVLFWSRTLVVTSVDNPRPLVRVVEDVLAVRPEGLTDVALGLTAGLGQLERSRARERLGILVTDGVSNHGADPAGVARRFPRLHVLTTATTPRRLAACRRIAANGNGVCLPVPTVADIPTALTHCLDDRAA